MGQDATKQLWDNRITKHNLDVGAITWQGKSKQKTLLCIGAQQNT